MSGPSQAALDAAAAAHRGAVQRSGELDSSWLADETLNAAHDAALGLDRSVCLREVVEALEGRGDVLAASWLKRTRGGGR